MKSQEALSEIMRSDWNRRVRHDYRFWITNEVSSGSTLWEDGARDFEMIHHGITPDPSHTALEIGCGVGRMLPAARKHYQRVIGVDVSSSAIEKARELLCSHEGIEVHATSGCALSGIESGSVDFVWSFAALPHMPVRIIAAYLAEIKRVLCPSGIARLQMFVGGQSGVSETDTLRLRAFTKSNIEQALVSAGMALESITPTRFPLSDLLDDIGLEAVIVTARPAARHSEAIDVIARWLCPSGESASESSLASSQFEAWFALHYADKLYHDGDFDRARDALEYVTQYCKAAQIDIRDTLENIEQAAKRSTKTAGVSSPPDFYSTNMAVLRERFPSVYHQLRAHSQSSTSTIEIRETAEGPTLWFNKTCMDHPQKPHSGADAWVKRSLNDSRMSKASHLCVVGMGCGYHLESLVVRGSHAVSCVEPSIESFVRAIRARDMSHLLGQLSNLVVGEETGQLVCDGEAEVLVRPQEMVAHASFVQAFTSSFYGRRGLSVLHPRIAVLGPLQGGTLPIGQYTTSALSRLDQHVRGIDMSGFNGAYEKIGGLVRDDVRQNVSRQAYVEMLSAILLESFTEKPVDILICMAQAPISARALQELRRRGVVTVLWFLEDYLRFTYWREMARYYDHVFTIQRGPCIEAIQAAGAGHVHYLPAACDPYIHTPLEVSEEDRQTWGSPLSFVGAGYYNRQQTFANLAHYPFKIWGSEWPLCKPFDRMVQQNARRIAPEEYIKIFNATDININLHSSSERDGVDPTGDFLNPRTFELAACGAFQLVDERSLLAEAFDVGSEIITFNSLPDLRDKIDFYMERPEERKRIGERARQRALREHTYEARLRQMLSMIYGHEYQKLKSREQSSPWLEMARKADFDPELRERCEKAFARGAEPTLDGLVEDITLGQGNLTEAEQKLLFLFHVRKQITRMESEEAGKEK